MDLHAPSHLPYDLDAFHALFRAPPAGYRGAPFWSWNGELRRDELLGHLDRFREMGMGGAMPHPRTGLRVPFMSGEFLGHLRASAEAQAAHGDLLWLYDEDRWPSGYGGGLVTGDRPDLRKRYLVLTRVAAADFSPPTWPLWHSSTRRNGSGNLVARWAAQRDGARLLACRRLDLEGAVTLAEGEEAWFAYEETIEPLPWYNHAAYIDCLNPKAAERFTEVVHDGFAKALGDHLGRTVPAVFTDEPMLSEMWPPQRADEAGDVLLSWTGDFVASYRARFAADPLDTLLEVVFDRADGEPGPARWRYHQHRAERFASGFAAVLGRWCDDHGVALTGHLMAEDSLSSQTAFVGECMASYRHFGIPGIDLLCDHHSPVTAKQAVSVARQLGRTAVASELYGVTSWSFDFTGHKRQGDWQAALGITVRIHHLSWVSMAGESKRDYPAPIDWHSPWWREYALVEDHFARVHTALTRGTPRVRIGVLHPVESAWHLAGPGDGSGSRRGRLDERFTRLAHGLIDGLIDFDYIAESLLPELHQPGTELRFAVGAMTYEVLVLPWFHTIRRTTLDALVAFHRQGGRVIVLGRGPTCVEGLADPATALLADCEHLNDDDLGRLLAGLEPVRDLRATTAAGEPARRLTSQQRDDGAARWLFVCDHDKAGTGQGPLTLAVRGRWQVERFDTIAGTSAPIATAHTADGWTTWPWEARVAGHELVRLSPATAAITAAPSTGTAMESWSLAAVLHGPAELALDEPNSLVLDRAEFRLAEDQPWEGPIELLRLDNLVRQRVGLPAIHGDIAQPWAEPPAPVVGTVDLRFRLRSEVLVRGARLALEQAGTSRLWLDGIEIPCTVDGSWVDPCFGLVALPDLTPGDHELILRQELRHDTTREWCHLLGDFGVALSEDLRCAWLTAPPRHLAPADQVHQGLPFYGGNTRQRFSVELAQAGNHRLELGPSAAPLVRVAVDGQSHGRDQRPAGHPFTAPLVRAAVDGQSLPAIAFPPYALDLGWLDAGRHVVELTVFGNRANTFGPIHQALGTSIWQGPNAWRTGGDEWSEAWNLLPTGLNRPPRLLRLR